MAAPYWGGDDDWQYEGFTLREGFASKLPNGTPIFFYHSRDDDIVPFAHLALYAEKLPQATIREIDHRGHQFKNDLFEVVEDIKSCLEDL
jgi:predicted alpha/beta hydrolase family esterase